MVALRPVLSQTKALTLVGMARSTWHYRHHPRSPVTAPVPHRQRRSESWLSADDEALIVVCLQVWAQVSIAEAFVLAWDAGVYVASQRTWYRVAHRCGDPTLARPARRRAKLPPRAVPELVATAPNQVWSWDITKLPTRYRRHSFEFYVVLDLYSRYVVAWRVELAESEELAKDMFAAAFDRHQAQPRIVHSDGGPSMTSKTVQQLFSDLAITPSRNRPRVSNDNPYSEAWFKTSKYHPSYPVEFHDLERARVWAEEFIAWYNDDHRHSGIAWHTPANVFRGEHHAVTARRQRVLDQHHQRHPDRYTQRPQAPQVPIEAWINDPRRHGVRV